LRFTSVYLFHSGGRDRLVTDSDAAYLAVFHAGRSIFPVTAQIAFDSLITGFVEIYPFRFERTGFYAEPATGATIRIYIDNALLLIYMHSHFFFRAGIIARVIRTMLAGINTVFQ
jgi:hypothetical protein